MMSPLQARAEARATPRAPSPLVSVLVPAFNHARFIEECLESIRTETYPAKEIILLDDGSSDDTFELASAWLETHAHCFERVQALRQPNQGICKTLNRLVSHARGEYVTLLASDDALLEGGIDRRVRILEENADWLAVFGDAELMGPRGERLASSAMESLYRSDKRMLRNPPSMAKELLLHWAVPGPVLLLRRTAYDPVLGVGLYSEDLAVVEDRDFYLRLLATRRLGFVDQPVAKYRIHTNNLSGQPEQKPAMLRDHLLSCTRNLARFEGFDRFCLALNVDGITHYVRAREKRGIPAVAHRTCYLLIRLVMRVILSSCRIHNATKSQEDEF